MKPIANAIIEKWSDPTTKQLTEGLLHGSRPGWNTEIKTLMGNLGNNLGFLVSASGYKGADQGEFLYDMVWFQLEDEYVTSQTMVMELEWGLAPKIGVDDDFQKLVQARADVRVWVSNCADAQHIAQQVECCKQQIRLFGGSRLDDEYVLVFFDWAIRKAPTIHSLRASEC